MDFAVPPGPSRAGARGRAGRRRPHRLSFPDGPVARLDDVPVALRAALTCRCHAGPGHRRGQGACGSAATD